MESSYEYRHRVREEPALFCADPSIIIHNDYFPTGFHRSPWWDLESGVQVAAVGLIEHSRGHVNAPDLPQWDVTFNLWGLATNSPAAFQEHHPTTPPFICAFADNSIGISWWRVCEPGDSWWSMIGAVNVIIQTEQGFIIPEVNCGEAFHGRMSIILSI